MQCIKNNMLYENAEGGGSTVFFAWDLYWARKMESPISCAAFQGVFSKSFLHLMLYTVKKCVVCPSPVRMSSTPWIITLFLDQGVLDILAKGRENRTFFLQCITNIPLLRILLFGSVVVKFEQSIVVILCTKILKSVLTSLLYAVY